MHKYSECMEVIQREVVEDDSNPDLFVVRAQLNLLFGQVRTAPLKGGENYHFSPQTSDGYGDVCKALALKPGHAEALEMKEDLEKKARQCKDQVFAVACSTKQGSPSFFSRLCTRAYWGRTWML